VVSDCKATPQRGAGKRVRDPEGHRTAILEAMRVTLSERGYAGTTIREVARRAGVTHGSVMHHFRSKEALAIAAVPSTTDLFAIALGEPATLPERLAESWVKRLDASTSDLLLALIHTASADRQLGVRLYEAMRERTVVALAGSLAGTDVDDRLDLVAAQLIGIAFNRYVIRSGPVAEMDVETLIDHLGGLLRHLLGPVLIPG
jgi:AcrR family transcriptional regulator